MGCFNMRCALTQLPVVNGDPVVLLIGVKANGDDFAYNGDYLTQLDVFQLLTTPLFGNYDDYGWIDNVEPGSMAAATEMLKAQGMEKAVKKGLKGKSFEDCLGAFTKALAATRPGAAPLNATYTIVHRQAWDKLLTYGREKINEVGALKISDQDIPLVKEVFPRMGFTKQKVHTYSDRKVYSAYGTPGMFFRAALEILPDHLPPMTQPLPPALNKDMSEEEMDRSMTAYMDQVQAFSNAKNPSSMGSWLGKNFIWFRQLMTTEDNYGHAYPVRDTMLPALQAARANPAIAQILEDTAVIYQSLRENRLVVRAHDDMPAQGQNNSHWGHVALASATGSILEAHAEKYLAGEDVEDNADVVALMVDYQLHPRY